jgi:hypothetical protein
MASLPIRRMILYKHGVGYFERRGAAEGSELRLSFPREAMDDVLKSLVAIDMGAGQVLSIDYETPEDRAALLARGSIHLSEGRSLLDLLRDLRGRRVRLSASDASDPSGVAQIDGLVVGVDVEEENPLRRPIVTLYLPEGRQVRTLPVADVRNLTLLDEAADDLGYFLRASQSEEDRRNATLHLSPGDHNLLVGYIAPAPAWRVSYRMLFENEELRIENAEKPAVAESSDAGIDSSAPFSIRNSQFCLLQGWGLFDNQLEEDLENVALTLVAGMPVSFRYRLYEPRTPERPLVEDEERTVNAPIFFDAAPPVAAAPMAMPAPAAKMRAAGRGAMLSAADDMVMSSAAMEESVAVSASGEERGALFAYRVAHPVSVARGQSAMVPILSQRVSARRDLLYNGRKQPKHPVASLRLKNESGLTLERGPVTVLEDGDYAGEAVVPFTRAGGELIVPYAVELGISVSEQRKSERRMVGISVRHEYLLIQEYDIQRTDYHITSTVGEQTTVMVEHPLGANYELFDTPAPFERTAEVARWEVACAPQQRTIFTVAERQLVSRNEQVRSLTMERLRQYLKDKFLDEATMAGLREVLDLYGEIATAQRRLAAIEAERKQIYAAQKQVQGSLAPLGTQGEEGALRQRYVATLNQSEDRLNALAAEEQQLNARIATLEQQAAERLRALGK